MTETARMVTDCCRMVMTVKAAFATASKETSYRMGTTVSYLHCCRGFSGSGSVIARMDSLSMTGIDCCCCRKETGSSTVATGSCYCSTSWEWCQNRSRPIEKKSTSKTRTDLLLVDLTSRMSPLTSYTD